MKTLISLVLFVFTIAAQTPAPKGGISLDKPAFEAYLRHMELWLPQVAVKIDDPKPAPYLKGFSEVVVHLSYSGQSKEERYFVSADGKNFVKGDVFDMGRSPFQETLDKLKTDQQPAYGSANPLVTIVVFGDFQCPYCKEEADDMRGNLLKTFPKDVRVYFKDFPLDAIHPWARPASIAGRCVYKQDEQKFWTFHDWIYGVQEEIKPETLNDRVMKWAGENGVDAAQLKQCIETKATQADVDRNVKEGVSLGVSSTPTLFVNGRKFEGTLEWAVMEQLIKFEIAYQADAKSARK
jgi:protein-disulfide isomerase